MIELKPIKHNNWMECIGLEVHDDQKGFVNPNIFFLAEAYAHSDANKDMQKNIIDAFRWQFITMIRWSDLWISCCWNR